MEFGKSFLLSLIAEKILDLGVNVAKETFNSNQESIDSFIRSIIPGEWLDDAAVQFVRENLQLVLDKISTSPKPTISSTLKDLSQVFK